MQKLPIGIQDFRELRTNGYLYVDKTQIIHQLVSSGKYYFLSRPRRFGKSLLVSTLKELFQGKRELFGGLWIADKWNWEEQHLVIHISFNDLGYKERGLREALDERLDELAATFDIVLNTKGIAGKFRKLIMSLSEKSKVVLLFDEYDKPLIDFMNDPELLETNRGILREFYSIIKSADPFLRFVLLTGVSRFSKVSIFSDLNNLNDITIDPNFSSIGGYTQKELEYYFENRIDALAKRQNIAKSTLLDQIKTWYNGYSWLGDEPVHNPFSILNFFQKGIFQNFWFATGTPNFLIDVLRESFQYDLDSIEVGVAQLDTLDIPNPDHRSLLFQTGYLTIKDQPLYNIYTLGYPNKEVKDALLQHLIGAYSFQPVGNSAPTVSKLKKALDEGKIDQFVSILNSLFASIPEKIFRQKNEASYHAIVYTALSLLGFYIDAEVSAGDGIVDAVVKTKDRIYIIEFKYDKPATDAIAQIRQKGYAEPYRHDGRQVQLLGISFGRTVKGITEWKEELL